MLPSALGGPCPRQQQRPAGSCAARAPAAPVRPASAARRCLLSIPPVYSIPSRPSHPTQSLPARPSGVRVPPRYSPDQHRRRGAAEETLGAGSAETPQFIPPEGQRRPGPRRAGAATFSLFGRLRATERPRSHEWSRAGPGAARPPAHVRQARGSAAPAAAWPNREPSAAPGGQRRRAGAGQGPGRGRRARSPARPPGSAPAGARTRRGASNS